MKLVLKPDERIEVTFEGTDGIITVAFVADTKEQVGNLSVHADMHDSQGRCGEIYREDFGGDPDDEKVGPAKFRILRSAASRQEEILAETMPDRYEIVDDPEEVDPIAKLISAANTLLEIVMTGPRPRCVETMLWVAYALRGNGKAAKQIAKVWHATDPTAPTGTFLEVARGESSHQFSRYYGVKVYRKVRLPGSIWSRNRVD